MTEACWRLRGRLRERDLSVEVPDEGIVVGSGADCDLVLSDETVSREHAKLIPVDAGLKLDDLRSTNGTWIEGRRIESLTVGAGTSVLFGRVALTIERLAAADRVVAVELPGDSTPQVFDPPLIGLPRENNATTLGLAPVGLAVDSYYPSLLEHLSDRSEVTELLQFAGAALFRLLSLDGLEVSDDRRAILYSAGETDSDEVIAISRGRITVRAWAPRDLSRGPLRRLVESLAVSTTIALERTRPLPRPPAPVDPPQPLADGSVDPTVVDLYERSLRIARGDIGVLILGESGTGKEVFARHLHRVSGRQSITALNCAALPRDLLEAELFGVEKGTATGVEPRPGKFELAHEGTLFLDEVGDMSLETQAKILRVLQEGEVYRLGGSQPRPARTRVVAATNRDLDELVEGEQFRLDLYHRIAGWVVSLPALRHRLADIPNLAARFLAEAGRKQGHRYRGITRGALDLLIAHPWPGNIRELKQQINRSALFMDDGDVLETRHLGSRLQSEDETATTDDLASRLQAFEKREIETALAACGGKVSVAAERLGMHRASLYRRVKALGIESVAT